jgi:hypothetical protein
MNKIVMRYLLVCVAGLFLSAHLSADNVYKSVDANGNITYSDVPAGQKIDPVDLPHINTTPSIESQPYTPPVPAVVTHYAVAITAPQNGFEVLPAQRNLSVVADVTPSLVEGASAQLWMDNRPYGSSQSSASFTINEITRGEHQLVVVVLNAQGRVVARSDAVTVYVRRPSI